MLDYLYTGTMNGKAPLDSENRLQQQLERLYRQGRRLLKRSAELQKKSLELEERCKTLNMHSMLVPVQKRNQATEGADPSVVSGLTAGSANHSEER
jgi:hypothetical protein